MLSTVRAILNIQVPRQGNVTGRTAVNTNVTVPSVVVKALTTDRYSVV